MEKTSLIPHQIIATAIRIESEPSTDSIFIVFKVVEEGFKQKIRSDWMQDLELKVIGKNLVYK